MKDWIFLPLILIFLSSCGMSETEEDSGQDLYAGHRPVDNAIVVHTPPEGSYVAGDELILKVSHPYPLHVTGSPRIELNLGGASAFAEYAEGSGSKTLTFMLPVLAGFNAPGGVQFASNAIDLNGGSIAFVGTTGPQAASLAFDAQMENVVVDTKNPELISAIGPLPETYYLGQKLVFTLTFDEEVYVSGSPKAPIKIGSQTVYADYISGSASQVLRFQYIVVGGDLETSEIHLGSPIDLTTGSIKDRAGNHIQNDHSDIGFPGVRVDGDSPYARTFIPPADGVYKPGESLEFSLVFTEPITVTGTPRVGIEIGDQIKLAHYSSGSGSDTLVFRYTVVTGDKDTNGIDVQNLIELNGGSLRSAGGKNAILKIDAPIAPHVLVDAALPKVTSITLPTPPADNYFNASEDIFITLNFNENMLVEGFPQLGMKLASSPSTIYFDYSSGSGTSSLVFRYTVVDEVDEDHDGLELVSPLVLNDGKIESDKGVRAELNFADVVAATDFSQMLVDATTPVVEEIQAPAGQVYILGANIDFAVVFSEPVFATGTPRIAINVGGATRYARYHSGNGGKALIFRWTVENGYEDLDGIEISATQISNGQIRDRGGNIADYDISGRIPNLSSVLVDGIRPKISSVSIPDGTYGEGESFEASVVFDDVVFVNGAPTLSANFDLGSPPPLAFKGGSTSDTLVFEHTVALGEGSNSVQLATVIALNGATTIRDINGNNAILTLSNRNFPLVIVDAVAPVLSITSPTNGDYINETSNTASFPLAGTCDDATAAYSLLINGVPLAGSLACDGAVLSGSFDATAIPEGAFVLSVEAQDPKGNIGSSNSVSMIKDITPPTVLSINAPADGSYLMGSVLNFTVVYDDIVIASGSSLELDVGGKTISASYLSGSGTSSLVYTYTIGPDERDDDGIEIISIDGGIIQDAAGNDADRNFGSGITGIKVNDGTPEFIWLDEFDSPITAYDFGPQNGPTTATFKIKNVGESPSSANLQTQIQTGGSYFSVHDDSDCVGAILVMQETCIITIKFDPDGSGSSTREIYFQDLDFSKSSTLEVTGTKDIP